MLPLIQTRQLIVARRQRLGVFIPVCVPVVPDPPSITAKLISEQKDDKEKKNHEEKEKMKADNGFQDNYSVVVASG